MNSRRQLRVGTGVLLIMIALSLAAPWIASSTSPVALIPHGPLELHQQSILASPSATHWLGTDQVGRDLLSRLIHGGRRSLTTGLVATVLAVLLATFFGAAAGVAGGAVDTLLSRLGDIVYAFPVLVGAIALLGATSSSAWAMTSPSVRVGVVIGLFYWPVLFRFLRAEVQRRARSEMADSARAAGCSALRVTMRHLLPAAAVPALVPASFLAAGSILVEAGLGFLGLGIRPPEPSWGNLILDGMNNVDTAWWLVTFPGLVVFVTVLAFHFLGEGLRGRLDP